MKKHTITTKAIATMAILILVLLPGIAWAQGGWPPLEVEISLLEPDSNGLVRYDILLKNISDVALMDVILTSTLPEGVSFHHFETIDYATTSFDGQTVSFTILQLPTGKVIGPMSTYLKVNETASPGLTTSIYAEWRGQIPGTLFIPDMSMTNGEVDTQTAIEETGDAAEEAVEADTTTPTEEEKPAPVEPTVEAPKPAPTEPLLGPDMVSFALWDMLDVLESHEFVDLTNTFEPGIPRWPGFPDAEFKTIYDYDTDGFFAQEFVHVGQFGTHMDPPAHFHKGLRTLDQIDLKEMVAPLVVINVADKVAANPDYELTVEDIQLWEAKYGPVPPGAFVAMRSDWSKRWPDIESYANKDETGQAHYPGWSVDALKYLYEERQIVGSGHEPPDTDAALAQTETGFAAETYVLGTDHYQIELLTNLDKVPEAGAIVFVTVPKPKSGSGFPARVFAVIP